MYNIILDVLFLAVICTCDAQQRRPGNSAAPDIIFGGFSPKLPDTGPANTGGSKPLRFVPADEARRSSFIQSSTSRPPAQRSGFKPVQRTTPPSFSSFQDDYDDYEYDPLPSGPTRIPDLPSGPTRRPGQPTPRTDLPSIGIPRDVFQALPLLTTPKPSTLSPRNNVNFLLSPPRGDRARIEPDFQLPRINPQSGFFVTSDLDILDQTKLFTNMDPNQEQFIKAPILNAGALPLAFQSNIPLNQYPPFNIEP